MMCCAAFTTFRSFFFTTVQLAYQTVTQFVRMDSVVLLSKFNSSFWGSLACFSFLRNKSLCWAFFTSWKVLAVHVSCLEVVTPRNFRDPTISTVSPCMWSRESSHTFDLLKSMASSFVYDVLTTRSLFFAPRNRMIHLPSIVGIILACPSAQWATHASWIQTGDTVTFRLTPKRDGQTKSGLLKQGL